MARAREAGACMVSHHTTRPVLIASLLASLSGVSFAQDDAASGLDFWAVTGLKPGSSLNVRVGPSSSTDIALQISEGTILRNLGCEGKGDARWCRVESPDGLAIAGWVSGAYLRESGAPPDADALVAGTRYNATGTLPCILIDYPGTTECPFGVIRAPTGLASVFITLPDGSERLIEFREKAPLTPTGRTMTSSRNDDLTTVVLDGGKETYTIADVVFGD